MLFNRHGLQQKNWRMVKKGKHILFGCSLFFVVGGMSISGSQAVHASETNASRVVEEKVVANNTNSEISEVKASTLEKEQVSEASNDKKAEKIKQTQDVKKPAEKNEKKENLIGEKGEEPLVKKEVNKKELKDLVDKIKKTDISKKTEKSVKELNLILSRAEKALDNKEITQEEIDKEVKLLKEVFERLEDKPREDKKSEIKEKDDKSNSEKDTKEKQQDNNTEDVPRKHDEKITKATNIVKEINSLATEINYEFSDSEKELVRTIEKLPTTDNNSKESIQKLLNEAIYLRNRVANRVTRANSGRRDPRNGQVIDKNGESGFRGVVYKHIENRRNGNLIENGNTAVYYNSDEIWSLVEIKGERVGNERKFTTFVRGKVVEDVTPYYIVTVGFTGDSPIKGLKMHVAYWDKQAGKAKSREIEYGRTEINNPMTNAAIRGVVGEGAIVQPGRYEVHIASNTRVAPNQLKSYTFTFIIKPQSERNTVKDLSQTYVDDVRHLTENEKTALIEKFKTEHPDVMKPSGHKSDFDHAEVSADGATMTIHFKDGFNPKTIQTNATNDVEAKHSSLTAYFGDNKELYTNPRQLVRSKTGNEVPSTAQVTYKTPFNLQQFGTRNVVVTTTYENGVTKDVTTPYTVLDFIGKQDKKINQNQSGQLGDARNYITVSDNSALPGEFTVRWKGDSSTVDTSAAGVQHKEIEILRGNHLMKTVRIPVEIVDNINPTITAPDSVLLTRLEGLPSEINISAQDNNKGVGLKDGNPITVENLPNPLFYNPKTSKIEINGVIPNNFQNGKSSIQVTVKAVDRKGNTATKNITFNIQSQTQKYTAVANPKIQEVSHAQTPDPGTSISTTGLPANTQYKWERKPDTNTPGNKDGVVKVTYPDGSTDTVNVTVKVRKLSDEHEPTATKIVKNQNDSVSNNDLKAAVTINNNGNSKVRSVTFLGNISTTNAGTQTINATVTYLDGTTDPVTIPLEVKDTTGPTIQTPTDRQNWDLIALDRTLPPIKVTSVDNAGGTGVKSTNVTGLPDFLVYDNATKTIKFKNGVQEVTKLPVGQDSKIYNINIHVTDNSNNSSHRLVTITVKSMTTKYNATANSQKQTVSYGETPNAETSINKNGLPTGTTYTWRTIPNTTTGPGEKAGVVIVTYPDGSTDLVDVTVDVRKLSDEYEPTGTKIVKNQNATVTNDDLKAAVTISNNGNSKVKSITPVGTISTVTAGMTTIKATVTYKDNTTDPVTIPLEVKDVIAPTIQTPTEGQLWEITSLDKTLPPIRVETSDNSGGSGVKSIVPINLPSFLNFNKATNSIVFQDGVREVPKLSGINRTTKTVTLRVGDNAGNSSERTFQIRQISMAEKYNPQANTTIQEVSHGEIPNPKTSINTAGLPAGVQYTWKSTPDTTKPGDKTGVVTVTYPDDSIDEVNVTVKVRKLSDEYEPTATKIVKNQNDLVSNDELKAAVTISNNGASKVKSVTPVDEISTTEFGNKTINATVTYLDDTTDTVTIPLEVKDITPPTIQTPANGQNWDLIAVEGENPNIAVTSEDNTGGSGVKTTTVTGLPDFLTYDEATKTIKFKDGVTQVPSLPEGTDVEPHNVTITVVDNVGNKTSTPVIITVKSMTTKYDAVPNSEKQTVSYGATPDAATSVDKTNLPEGTRYAWTTTPDTNTPGEKVGVVEVTYKDGSKDTVTVKVTVKELSSEYEVTGSLIEVNQNTPVTNDDLKAKVTARSKVGNVDGTDKILKVEPKTEISTANYGDQTISATVTFKDGTTKDVTIPLKVKDVTKPAIQAPTNGQNWDLIAVEGENPNIAVTSEDNAGGSGVKSTTVTGLPDFLEYNESTKKIQFKEGVTSVPSLIEGTDVQPHNVTITVLDNAGNEATTNVTITVKSMTTKYDAIPNSEKQTVSYGETPDAATSVNTSGLPEGTSYAWKTTPDTNTPGEKDGVVEVTYKDGSKDTVNVKVTVKELSSEYEVTGSLIEVNQNTPVTNDDLKAKVTAISKVGNVSGTDKISTVVPKSPISTANYGDQTISATVTFKDGTTKDVTIPLKVKDVTPPTIQTPANGQNWDLIAVEGENPNIAITSEDNTGGSGVKTTTVAGLPDFLTYDEATKTIKFKDGVTQVPSLPEGTNVQPHNVTITVVDNAGNKTSTQVTITVKSMTTKYDAVPNSEKQTVSYGEELDAGASINKSGLSTGTTYTWETKPSTTEGPGNKAGIVTVTYPDGSKDTVNVTVSVRGLADEYEPTVIKIVKNQNDTVSSEDLKSAVTISNNGNIKVKTVSTVGTISTTEVGVKEITATVTYLDDTTDTVTIPLEVKDVTAPTIQTPTNGQNWDLIAVEGENPNIAVTSEDNAGGSGIKSTTVTGLPDFLEYNEATKMIQFKAGITSVPKLPEGIDVEPHNVTITVVDNAGNETSTQVTITVKSMTTKYEATANSDKQTVSYSEEPNAERSVNKTNLPEGTNYVWKTKPETITPGEKDGVVEVTYKDGSKDTVNVKVIVKELSSEYEVTGAPIEVNQNTLVTNDDLKAKVTARSKVGNVDGTDKISKVEPKSEISTANYGNQNITATVTFKDGTIKDVTIPLEVKDVTPPIITAPTENTNWEMTALDKTLPNMEVRAEDNANGSGVKTVSVEGLPDYLEYDSATNSIKFKARKQEVEKLPENTPSKEFNLNIRVEDNAGNVSEIAAKITVSSISTKTNPQPEDQTVNYGQTPNPEDSVNKQGLPDGTTVTWKTPPVVNKPGSTTGEVEITYPDGSKDVITVNVTVRKVSEEFTATGTQIEVNQNEEVTSDMLKGAVNATNAQGENGNTKISKVESKSPINTVAYGNQTIQAKVTYIDGSEQDVTIPLNVKDVTDPTISTPEENKNWEIAALDKTLPVMKIKAEDNANGSGIATIEVRNLPEFLTFDESTGTIVFKEGVQEVPKIKSDNTMYGLTIIARDKAGNSTSMLVNITVWSMRGKYNPQPKAQTVDNGTVPNAEDSVDKTGLPEGTTVTWKTNPDVSTPGDHPTVALVTYPDGTVDEVEVPITVKKQSDTFTPTAKQPGQTAKHGSDPSAEGSINTDNLPKGTTYTWVEKPDTNTTPGNKPGKVLITYPDKSTEEVPVTVEVTPQKDEYTPTAIPQTVDNGQVPKAEESVNKTGLPEGTTVTWKTTPEVSTPGSHPGVALVHYPDGTEDEVEVPVTVKEQKETFNPTAKEPNQTVRHNEVPDPEKSINTNGLPEGTTYTWSEQPNTSTPGSKPGKVLITYPDKSTEEVPVTVEVTPQKDEYTPTAIPQTVDNGQVPKAEESVNKTGLPEGTTVTWKTTPEVSTPGSHPGVALVHYPDGTEDEVTVQIVVRHSNEKGIPEVQLALPEFAGGVNTPDSPSRDIPEYTDPVGTSSTDGEGNKITPPTVEIPEYTDPVGTSSTDGEGNEITPPTVEIPEYTDPIGTSSTDGEGNVITPPIVEIPEYTDPIGTSSTDGEGNEITPPIVDIPEYTDPVGTSITDGEGNVITPPTAEVPEYTGGVNGEPEVQPILPEFAGGVNGEPEVQLALPEFNGGANGNPEVQPSLPEFNGGVNGDPEDQQTLPEFAGGVNGDPEVQLVLPEFAGGVNGDPEVQPVLPEFAGGVNGDPEAQPTLPEFNGGVNGESEVQSALPEFSGGVNGDPEIQEELPKYVGKLKDESEIRSSFRDKTSNVATKRLANTGQSQNNSELAGLGLAIVGLFAAIKRRKNEEE